MKRSTGFIFVLFITLTLTDLFGSPSAQRTLILHDNWKIQSAKEIRAKGNEISKVGFNTEEWYPASVPSTVLKILVENGAYPDPYYGTNLTKIPGFRKSLWIIKDMPKGSPFRNSWWYRTVFYLPENYNKNIWLKLNGINYKANVWLNGSLIADTTLVEGPYRLFELDVTKNVIYGGKNCLALEIIPPIKGTDLSIRWMEMTQTPPDKDTGIWYNVKITANGELKIRYPRVVTDLNLPDTTVAYVTVFADILNNSSKPVRGFLKGEIVPVDNIKEGGNSLGGSAVFKFSREISLSPNETKEVRSLIEIENPHLWWPHLSGRQNLYDLKLRAITDDGKLADKKAIRFGIRKIVSYLRSYGNDRAPVRIFQINGRNIFVKGGNWTQTMMMEQAPERNRAEIKYMLDMNFNAIRTEGFWGDDYFFDMCDKYGIMIFDGFNCCSIWERWKHWTKHTYEIAGKSFRDQIIRKRNHPCFVDWLLGSDRHPPVDVEQMYVNIAKKYDGTRPYQSNAMMDTTVVCGCTGVSHDPYPETYSYLSPSVWYTGGKFGKYEFREFNTEVGPGGEQIPPIESMREMMPREDLWPISESWDLRLFGELYSPARKAFFKRYGKPKDIEAYTVRAQVFQKETFRAMIEAYRKNKYQSSGILLYRVNAGWPALCYHLYDYFLRPNGAFSAVQQAFEPLHVQYSYDDSTVFVVNDLYRNFNNLKVSAVIFDLNMSKRYSNSVKINVTKDTAVAVFKIPHIANLSRTYFLNLTLKDETDKLISSNFYWLSAENDKEANFSDLMKLPPVKLNVSAVFENKSTESSIRLKIKNPSHHLAFFVNPKILKGENGEELLPACWNSKYFSILPGESKAVNVRFNRVELNASNPYLLLEGWNVVPLEISLLSPNKELTPVFTYQQVKIPERINRGQKFDISVIVKNSAKSGKAVLKSQQYLYIDHQPVSYKRVALSPGETKKLVWPSVKINVPGTHLIKVGSMTPIKIFVTE